MPLVLNPEETERPVTYLWDPKVKAQCNEASEAIKELCDKNFRIVRMDAVEGCAQLEPTRAIAEGLFAFRVLSENGDDVIVWDRRELDQMLEAKQLFNDYVAKGYKAYVLRSNGERGSRVESFDELLETIVVSDKEPIREANLVPPTHPG